MPPERGWKLRISDIIDAIAAIQEYTAGMNLKSFAEDRKTVDAVVRNFTIIGEAAIRIPEQVIAENPKIPWRDMSDMRNIIVHEYFGVSNKILWETIQSDLPPLVPLLKKLLESKD
jgi:uncharacterized protein with HEPN domain